MHHRRNPVEHWSVVLCTVTWTRIRNSAINSEEHPFLSVSTPRLTDAPPSPLSEQSLFPFGCLLLLASCLPAPQKRLLSSSSSSFSSSSRSLSLSWAVALRCSANNYNNSNNNKTITIIVVVINHRVIVVVVAVVVVYTTLWGLFLGLCVRVLVTVLFEISRDLFHHVLCVLARNQRSPRTTTQSMEPSNTAKGTRLGHSVTVVRVGLGLC